MSARLAVALFLAAAMGICPVARAQDVTVTAPPACQAGRVITEQSLGRCCWSGQSFSIDRARCEGPPACPAATVAHGDDCVPAPHPTRAPEMATSIAGYEPEPEPTASAWRSSVGPPTTSVNPRFRSAAHGPTVGLGLAALILTHAPLAVLGAVVGARGHWDQAAGYAAPVAGPLVFAVVEFSSGAAAEGLLLLGAGALQLVGMIVMAFGGNSNRVVELDGARPSRGLTLGPEGLSVVF